MLLLVSARILYDGRLMVRVYAIGADVPLLKKWLLTAWTIPQWKRSLFVASVTQFLIIGAPATIKAKLNYMTKETDNVILPLPLPASRS